MSWRAFVEGNPRVLPDCIEVTIILTDGQQKVERLLTLNNGLIDEAGLSIAATQLARSIPTVTDLGNLKVFSTTLTPGREIILTSDVVLSDEELAKRAFLADWFKLVRVLTVLPIAQQFTGVAGDESAIVDLQNAVRNAYLPEYIYAMFGLPEPPVKG